MPMRTNDLGKREDEMEGFTKLRSDGRFAVLCLATLTACGGGGGGAGGNGSPGGGGDGSGNAASLGPGLLQIVASVPEANAIQVALDQPLRVTTDGRLHPASVRPDCATLFDLDRRTRHPGTVVLEEDGRSLRFVPASALRSDTRYRLTVDALVCADDGRLLEYARPLDFTSLDTLSPSVIRVDGPIQGILGQGVPLTVQFDEAIDPAPFATPGAVRILDHANQPWPATHRVADNRLVVTPLIDLPGNGRYRVEVAAAGDRLGNVAANGTAHEFLTAVDVHPPLRIGAWPASGAPVSPLVRPVLRYDESLALESIPFGSITAWTSTGAAIQVDVAPSADQRRLTLIPLEPLPSGTVTFEVPAGPGLMADHSGNHGWTQETIQFTVGNDTTAPTVVRSSPMDGATIEPEAVSLAIDFDEDLDVASLQNRAATLRALDDSAAEVPLRTPRVLAGTRLLLEPEAALQPRTSYELTLYGGAGGLTDLAGNPLTADHSLTFATGSRFDALGVTSWPQDGADGVARNAQLALRFSAALAPDSLHAASTALVWLGPDDGETPLGHTATLHQGDRLLTVIPGTPFAPDQRYELRVIGGAAGLRGVAGEALAESLCVSFRTGVALDVTAPSCTVTLDAIEDQRNGDLAVGPHGFEVDVDGRDVQGGALDWSSVVVTITGPQGTALDPATVQVLGTPRADSFALRIPESHALPAGRYRVEASVADLAGNRSAADGLDFEVVPATAGRMPFERTQVVWVRFDLDRDRSGISDFDEDLLRLGLTAAGDPLGINANVHDLVADGVLRRVRALYTRGFDGSRPADEANTVAIVFTDQEPAGLTSMQIACGGLDPEGQPGRSYGDPSSGVLGRAFFDRTNGSFDQHATATAPGLGVFPAEMFLFEAGIHRSIYPSFVTSFARRFLPFCAPMGGTPVGTGPHDAAALASDYDDSTASSAARARREAILAAADDWATVVGTILAHEVGHAVGLVAPGDNAASLHGDDTLHNAYAGVTDVMAPSLGYDSMTALGYRFRDLNLAYLRQHVLLR